MLVAVVLLLGAVLPLVVPAFFPAVDLWNHVGVHEVQRQVLTGAGPMAGLYRFEWSAYPYSAGYLFHALLRTFMDPVRAGAAVLALSHVLLVAGAVALCRVLRIHTQLALLAFAGCFSMATWYGFTPYWAGLGPAFMALASALWLMEAPSVKRGLLVGALFLVHFQTHVEAYAAAGFLAGMAAVLHPDRWRRLAVLLTATLPSLLLAGWWWMGQTHAGEAPLKIIHGPLKDRLGAWPLHHLWNEGWAGMVPVVVYAGGALGLSWAWRNARQSSTAKTLAGLALGAVILQLALPKAVEGGAVPAWGQSLRIGPVLTVVALACWSGLPVKWARPGVLLVAMLCLVMDAQAWCLAQRFTREVEPLANRLKQTRPGTRTMVVSAKGSEDFEDGTVHYLAHTGALWVIHGAVSRQVFTVPGTRLSARNQALLPPHPAELSQPPCAWAGRLDQVLLQGQLPELQTQLTAAGFTAAWSHARWTLLERTGPPPDPQPCGQPP